MARSKKTRKGGENGPKHAPRVKKADRDAPKGKRSETGRKSGSRHNEGMLKQNAPVSASAKAKDPRHGSKKPIALTVDAPKPQSPKANKPKKPKMSDEQKLVAIENDPRFNSLLDLLEEGRVISAEDQAWLDTQLDQMEVLMERLGLNELEEEAPKAKKTKADSDDDLLDRFESGESMLQNYFSKD